MWIFIVLQFFTDKIVAEKVNNIDVITAAHSAESNISFSIQQVLSINQESLEVLKNNSRDHFDWLCCKLQLNLSNIRYDSVPFFVWYLFVSFSV